MAGYYPHYRRVSTSSFAVINGGKVNGGFLPKAATMAANPHIS
jgi:hypothetical protein